MNTRMSAAVQEWAAAIQVVFAIVVAIATVYYARFTRKYFEVQFPPEIDLAAYPKPNKSGIDGMSVANNARCSVRDLRVIASTPEVETTDPSGNAASVMKCLLSWTFSGKLRAGRTVRFDCPNVVADAKNILEAHHRTVSWLLFEVSYRRVADNRPFAFVQRYQISASEPSMLFVDRRPRKIGPPYGSHILRRIEQ